MHEPALKRRLLQASSAAIIGACALFGHIAGAQNVDTSDEDSIPALNSAVLAAKQTLGEATPANDLSEQFEAVRNQLGADASPAEKANLSKYKIVFIPGVFVDLIVQLQKLPGADHFQWGQNFNDQMRWLDSLKAQGVDTEYLRPDRTVLNTEHTSAQLAGVLKDLAQQSDRPVIFISHSKGCNDVLEALIDFPELKGNSTGHVAGWICMEGPFAGSPIVDWARNTGPIALFSDGILRMVGTPESLFQLTTANSKAYAQQHAGEIQGLIQSLPVISFVGWKDKDVPIMPVLRIPNRLMKKAGLENDGLVPLESARSLPFDFVVSPETDHGDPVMYAADDGFNRVQTTRALLNLLFQKLN